MKRLFDLPETNVAMFALLLNLTWEFAQVPLFAGMSTMNHWEAIQVCGRATLGDVAIALAAYWTVSVAVGARAWILAPAPGPVAVIPILNVGLSPVLQ